MVERAPSWDPRPLEPQSLAPQSLALPTRGRQKGFSLVELLIVMFILAVCMLGLMMLQISNIRSSAGSRNREMAVSLAKSLLDEIQAVALANRLTLYNIDPPANIAGSSYIAAGVNTGTIFYDNSGRQLPNPGNSIYTLIWRSAPAQNNIPRAREINIEASWVSGKDKSGNDIPKENGSGVFQKLTMTRLIQH